MIYETLDLPQDFQDKILRTFGNKGSAWLDALPEIVHQCVTDWELSELKPVADLSYNFVRYALSSLHGQVVLKIGVPHADLFTEMQVLKLYRGRHICNCFAADPTIGALLLERVVPGTNLTTLPTTRERAEVVARMVEKLPITFSSECSLPTFSHWIGKAFKRTRNEGWGGEKMSYLVDAAEAFFAELETLDSPKLILHGDLHHENILFDSGGGWKAIDPKGVIGGRHMEVARFMQNQIRIVSHEERSKCIDEMVGVFSTVLGATRRVYAMCGFVDCVLSTSWRYEDNAEPQDVATSIEHCYDFLEYIHHM